MKLTDKLRRATIHPYLEADIQKLLVEAADVIDKDSKTIVMLAKANAELANVICEIPPDQLKEIIASYKAEQKDTA